MTPEEIINGWEKALKKNLNVHEYHPIKESYIEAIKQYAKQMCDKQMDICANNAKVHYHSRDFRTSSIAPIVRQKVMISEIHKPSIINAPYPKELQD
jgi:hypothetical protein